MTHSSFAKYFPHDGVELLKANISKHQDWYLAQANTKSMHLPAARTSRVEVRLESIVYNDDINTLQNDIEHTLLIYQALKNLTPHQATDERLWSYLCHTNYRDYVYWRFISRIQSMNLLDAINNHYFVRDTRGLRLYNGISRLWWLGHIAHQVDPCNPKRVVQVLCRTADIRDHLLRRPSISSNVRVLRAIYNTMVKLADYDALFFSKNFRLWMKFLNRCGGVLVLDTLTDWELERLIESEAMRVLGGGGR